MGGGPSSEQKQAAKDQSALSKESIQLGREKSARENDQYAQIKPFAFSRLNFGNPYTPLFLDAQGGTIARAFEPIRAGVNQRFSQYDNLPSGSKEAALADVDAQQARAYDEALKGVLLNDENTKAEAARLITGQQQIANPIPYFQTASSANNSIMQAPLQSPGMAGMIGGLASSVIGKIPF
jgi:hypothetical protein